MAAPTEQQPLDIGRRARRRRLMNKEKRKKIADRVMEFYRDDQEARSNDRKLRLQRYAKFRQWTAGKQYPYPNASDQALPGITGAVLRTEDTLHNAVMSNRPVVSARALQKGNEEKQDRIDQLHDFQLFEEQKGETIVEELIDQFVKEGVFTAFIPWIKERRESSTLRIFDKPPENGSPVPYFERLLAREFPQSKIFPPDGDGWDWELEENGEKIQVAFYTKDDDLEMDVIREVDVYHGPRVFVKSYDEVVYPPRSANLQMPSPSNPGGAPHVILIDKPTVDEIARLQRSGFYNMIDIEDVKRLEHQREDRSDQGELDQKDTLRGHQEKRDDTDRKHGRLTRLVCFDLYDIDGDGIAKDMIWWVLLEPGLLLKAKKLTEMYPANPPRRPFAEATFLPVKGQREGIGLIELMEALQDFKKVVMDLMVDSGTLSNSPFFFYRPSSGLNPETFRPWPGDGIPVSDPKNDVFFPLMQNATQAWGINLMALITQMEERLAVIGDLQLGRVPAGKASALRTVGGIQTILAQGEARPERILRRFFNGLVEIIHQMFELNKAFLPDNKRFRILGPVPEGQDPYVEIASPSEIKGRFKFGFDANVLTASKAALQASLETLINVYVSDIAISIGIATPETIYRLFRDYGKALGQKPDRYLEPPTPTSTKERLTVEEAIVRIDSGDAQFDWLPAEGAQAHYEKLLAFIKSDALFSQVRQEAIPAYRQYLVQAAQAAQIERDMQARQLAAGAINTAPGQRGRPPEAPTGAAEEPTMVNQNELLQEELPGAQGRIQ